MRTFDLSSKEFYIGAYHVTKLERRMGFPLGVVTLTLDAASHMLRIDLDKQRFIGGLSEICTTDAEFELAQHVAKQISDDAAQNQ